MADIFDYKGDEDLIAHYEGQESDGERDSLNEAEVATFDDKDNESGTKRRIDPSTSKTRTVRNPMPKLDAERLKGPGGILSLEKYFENFKFLGNGHEKADLDRMMKRLEHWSHRLYPKYHFDDFLVRTEQVGSKKELQVYMKKYRQDMLTSDDGSIVHDNTDNEEDQQESAPLDDFDLLITEQIQKQKQAEIQTSMSASASAAEDAFNELLLQSDNISHSQILSTSTTKNELTDGTKAKIEKNKQMAIQRRLDRQNEREEAKRKKLAENVNAELPNENDFTVNDGIDPSQADSVQLQTNENLNEISCADKSEEMNIE